MMILGQLCEFRWVAHFEVHNVFFNEISTINYPKKKVFLWIRDTLFTFYSRYNIFESGVKKGNGTKRY
jgi:hypothetical protein